MDLEIRTRDKATGNETLEERFVRKVFVVLLEVLLGWCD